MPVRGVLFDVDDTLFDYSSSARTGLLAHLRVEGLLTLFPDADAAATLWDDIMESHYARFLGGEITFAEQQLARTRAFLAHPAVTPEAARSDAEAAAWFARYETHRRAAWSAFPDAGPALAALAPHYPLGIVSNSALHAQRRKLEHVGLLTYFGDRLICSDEYGAAKPAAGIFHAACALLGLPPHEVAYIGDNYAVDAVGAAQAGLRAFWLDRATARPRPPVRADIEVLTSLDELPRALTSASGAH